MFKLFARVGHPKENPNICFIPTATGDDEAYKVNFYSTFSQLNCTPSHLDFFKRTAKLEDIIFPQDIVFVGGGNTKSMLAVWKEWGLVQILKEAYEAGTIMCGVSAVAICWFEKGITDSWADELKFIDCLGFVSGFVSYILAFGLAFARLLLALEFEVVAGVNCFQTHLAPHTGHTPVCSLL